MEDYKKCYVAFLDILGFRNRIYNKNTTCKSILEIYKHLETPVSSLSVGNDATNTHDIEELERVKFKIMSDSICIYIEDYYKNALLCLAATCLNMQSQLLSLPSPILLRGAITHGNIYAEKDRTFGPALTDAYNMEEKNAYPRIIITKQVLDHGASNMDKDAIDDLYNSIFFCDRDKYYCIYPFAIMDKAHFQNLRKCVSQVLDTTMDDSIRRKYLYLDELMDRAHLRG